MTGREASWFLWRGGRAIGGPRAASFSTAAYGVLARTGACPRPSGRGMLGDRICEEIHMTKTILAGLALLVPVACRAADELKPFDAKPGLWETATKIEMPGMPSGPLM